MYIFQRPLGCRLTTALPHLNAFGARTTARVFRLRAKFCVPYLFSFACDSRLWDSGYSGGNVYGNDSAGLFCLTSLPSLAWPALPCLVELAFYICFNFLAISWTHLLCPCPLPTPPFPSLPLLMPLSISLRVYWPHLSVKWRWREAR